MCDKSRPRNESLLRLTAVRIVKNNPGLYGMPKIHCSADFYCKLLTEPKYYYETEDEIIFYVEHLRLADACLITACLDADSRWQPAAVLCEGSRIPWKLAEGQIRFTFEISGFTGKTRTLFVHTLIREPGMTVRIEQNAEGRRAGQYRKEAYPAVQIEAASHYVFATRKILKKLEVPELLAQEELGYILLLSFETCNEAHGDWPPHWHLILRWPDQCGSQAPHIYMDDQGRMTHNFMYIDLLPNVSYTYQPGQWCPFVDKYGREVIRCRVEEDGGLSLTREGRPMYTISAYHSGGVTVLEDGKLYGSLRVHNDTRQGLMQICWKNESGTEQTDWIRYDPLTGVTAESSMI